MAEASGAALLIDYGRDKPGSRRHPSGPAPACEKVDPLAHPGAADLTQWADFPRVLEAAVRAGADVTGCKGQGDFLRLLGIEARADRLIQGRPSAEAVIRRQLDRLTADDQMGTLFKACAIFSPRSLTVPGFE
jgi:NADH dehydrogenase [ubiquinone] 1 alpha subcomplex assembly factor 7